MGIADFGLPDAPPCHDNPKSAIRNPESPLRFAMTRIPIEDENDARGRGPVDMDAGDAEPVEAPPGAGGVAGTADAGDDVQKLRAERDDLYERYARALADAKNTQKR